MKLKTDQKEFQELVVYHDKYKISFSLTYTFNEIKYKHKITEHIALQFFFRASTLVMLLKQAKN